MGWRLETEIDEAREDEITEGLVEHNKARSEAVRLRFEPENLRSRPVAAYAVDESGEVIAGCVGHTEDVWQWLTIDKLWVRRERRGEGLGVAVLDAVERQARERGCRWAKVNTWEFQAPEFYERQGYVEYGRETDYPPGHVSYLLRKDL
jgi:GNAT superfamily N-acetyltransferase